MQWAARYSRWLVTAGLGLGTLGLSACATNTADYGSPAWYGSRTISLHQADTGESLTVTYGKDGRYDSAAMERVGKLMRDRRTGDISDVDPHLLDILVTVREKMNLPESTVFEVTSGYRSPITNASLARMSPNVAENSYHLKGRAVDFHIDGVSSERIAATAGAMGLGGYAWYPHTGHVHLDTGPVRTWTPRAPRRGGGWIEVRNTSRRSSMAVAAVPVKPTHGKPASSTASRNVAAQKPTTKPAGKPAAKAQVTQVSAKNKPSR